MGARRSQAATTLSLVDARVEADLSAGRAALAEWRLADARSRFEAVLAKDERPEALEGLAEAVGYLGDTRAAVDQRERAFALYRQRRDARGAARVAVGLALEHLARDDQAIAIGWLARARRLLDGEPACAEQAWLAVWEGHIAYFCRADLAGAKSRLAEGLALARRLELDEPELLGVGFEGVTLVAQGEIAAGLQRLDEAVTAAVNGELVDLTANGQACCYMLTACEQVHSFDRVAQWCERIQDKARRCGVPVTFSYCRSHWAAVLVWRGQWQEAEAELLAEVAEMTDVAPSVLHELHARLGDLRRRQGRWDEAERLFEQAGSHTKALVGRAALALDRGEPAEALRAIERLFRRLAPEDRVNRVAAWLCQVEAFAMLGRTEEVETALAALREMAAAAGTDGLRAGLAQVRGFALLSTDPAQACRAFEDAADGYDRARAPYEAARARLVLARALASLGEREAAREAASAAREAFSELGAERAALGAAELASGLEAEETDGVANPSAGAEFGLSRRQREVLALVAQGLSNRAIAERLHLSELTVKRHVADILTRLDLPSRAAAAAFAARHSLG